MTGKDGEGTPGKEEMVTGTGVKEEVVRCGEVPPPVHWRGCT